VKLRFIYILIALMLISLIGIIGLQGAWISDAYTAGEREYATHIHDALNAVNESIDEDEALLFIEEHMGGMDSILHELVIFKRQKGAPIEEQILLEKQEKNGHPETMHFEWHNEVTVIDSLHSETQEGARRTHQIRLESSRIPEITTQIELQSDSHKVQQVSSVIRKISTEQIFAGNLEARISRQELREKIRESMQREGVESSFAFGVYDEKNKEFVDSHTSKNYKRSRASDFEKSLFANDRLQKGKYTLRLQLPQQGAFVWAKIRPMLLMAIVFTILIVLSFGFALYFIFKQKKISQVKNDFINNMTHELKTPLASISLAASSIRHPQVIESPEEIKRFASIISEEERKMHRHIEQVLELAQIDRGEFELNIQSCDLYEILERSFATVRLSLEHAGGQLEWSRERMHAPLKADEFHLANVFTNILDNSIKYRGEALKIKVRIRVLSEAYEIEIEDNGIGMRAHEIRQAFDQFYRAETGNVHTRKGFGLGLSYVRRIVELHGGEVNIESEYQRGTVLRVRIPSAL
jgi:signal transduction histidine kinase